MTTYFDTDYQETGAGDLMAYIGREGDTPVYDRAGRPMDDEQKDRFIAKSERHEFERHMIISPENGNDLSNDEFGKETRRTMEEFAKADRAPRTPIRCIGIRRTRTLTSPSQARRRTSTWTRATLSRSASRRANGW